MSTSSITKLTSRDMQEIPRAEVQGPSLTTSPMSSHVSATSTQSHQSEPSPFAQLLSTLQQLEQSNPTEYQQVTAQIATDLESAGQTATADGNTSVASQVNQLATDFNNAPQIGQLPNTSDLAQAAGGGAGHHHHRQHVSSSDVSSETNNDSSSGSSSSTISPGGSDNAGGTQTGVNPYASPTTQTSPPPDGYQYVPFGTGTSVVPTMSNWLADWSNATNNMSPQAQLNQILESNYSNNSMFPGGNLPGTNIAANSLTQEQLAAYVQMTGTGQSIGDLQQFLSEYQGPDTLGNESYDQASNNSEAPALLQQDAAVATGLLS